MGVSNLPKGRSIDITENRSPDGVLTEDGNVENPKNPPKKQNRGADGEIVEASLLSPENDMPRLRPRKSVPSFQKVELNESDFERIVGKRVKVYWSGSRKWFAGCIKSFDNGSKLHKILYDDGDKEDLDLKAERFELEVLSSESFNLSFESRSHHKKKERSLDGGNCSTDYVSYQNPENSVKNDVLPDEDNVEQPPKKQKRGANGEATEVLLSSKRELPNSKLRPRKLVPSFQKVELNENDFERIIGKRVKVYWSGSRRWFVGCIKSFDNDTMLHRILYDDGDKEDLNLKLECFELEVMSTEAFNLGSNHKKEERRSYGGELKKEMIESGLLHERKATRNIVFLKEKLHEGKSTKVKADDMTRKWSLKYLEKPSKDQVTSNDVKFIKYRGDLGSEIRGQSVSAMPSGKAQNHVKNNVQSEEESVDKPTKQRKKSADGDITGGLLSSSKDIPNSKLRPRKSVPSFRKVELNESDFQRIVGKRVKVYWSGSRRWFTGCIKSFDGKKKLHKILYDDGESEDLNLKGERFELEVMSSEPFNLCFKSRPNSKKNVMTSDGGMVNEELKENGSLDVANVGQVKKNAPMNEKPISKATRKGRLQLHPKGTEKTHDMDRDMEIDVPAESNNDQGTCSENTYWQMYVAEV
ncbi:hypothetical protein AQUCO_00900292v1 [Aquilegia coerulea]|uniref:Tudor domain-containing protein n=1 Tax=Aquilegia coerulea TaxID=218851 RepID=A0A2G5ECX0_AQUCA|nr:hypothetical protein AQUCO_00900292v1 [Aquilegia coerulea]